MWFRKSIARLLSIVLLVCLIGAAATTSAAVTFSSPTKLEKMLDDSKLYDNFAVYATEQAQKSASNYGAEASLQKDPAIKDAASSAFSPQLLKQSVNQVLQSNYAWLNGRQAQPDFAVDLTGAKNNFAKLVGQYVQNRLASLPVCTPSQLALLPDPANLDYLSLDCRPAAVSPETAGLSVTQQVANSDNFLNDPVVTAQTINPKDTNNSGQPYYVKFASLPKAYQLGQKLPFILTALAILSLLGVIFVHTRRRRRGLRLAGIVFIIAAILLAIGKFISDYAFNRLDQKAFNQSSVGPLQHSLVNFTHIVQHRLVTINLYFALAYLLLGIILLLVLRRRRADQPIAPPAPTPAPNQPANNSAAPRKRIDVTGPPPVKKKPPRLVQ